jgi:hypothetical protein
MPTTRQYTFDIDTKRYLNRVNTYRLLNGLPNITNGDAVDIDNFIIGLKDLGLWNAMVCWLLRSQHNIGTGSTVLSLGSLGKSNNDGIMLNAFSTWGTNGITFGGTVANSARINLPADIRFQISYSASIFGCLNYQSGVIEDNNLAVFLWRDADNDPTFPTIQINQQASAGIVSSVNRNSTRYEINRGGVFSNGYSTVAASFEVNAQSSYKNGSFLARETNLGTINPASGSISTTPNCYIGRGNYVTGGVTLSISLVAAKVLTNSEMTSLHNLYKATIGKGLGLP